MDEQKWANQLRNAGWTNLADKVERGLTPSQAVFSELGSSFKENSTKEQPPPSNQLKELKKQIAEAEQQKEIDALKARLDRIKSPPKPKADLSWLRTVLIIGGIALMGIGFIAYHYNAVVGGGMVFAGILMMGGWYAMKLRG